MKDPAPTRKFGCGLINITGILAGLILHALSSSSMTTPTPDGKAMRRADRGKPAAESSGRSLVTEPLDQAIHREVERHLQRTLFDAASLEVVEWGPVLRHGTAYQLRCKFRSKNVLGKVVEQDRTFLVTRDGDAYRARARTASPEGSGRSRQPHDHSNGRDAKTHPAVSQ